MDGMYTSSDDYSDDGDSTDPNISNVNSNFLHHTEEQDEDDFSQSQEEDDDDGSDVSNHEYPSSSKMNFDRSVTSTSSHRQHSPSTHGQRIGLQYSSGDSEDVDDADSTEENEDDSNERNDSEADSMSDNIRHDQERREEIANNKTLKVKNRTSKDSTRLMSTNNNSDVDQDDDTEKNVVLRSDSSDDELLVNRKTLTKSAEKSKVKGTRTKNRAATIKIKKSKKDDKKSLVDTKMKKGSSKITGGSSVKKGSTGKRGYNTKSRKNSTPLGDDEEIMAAVVVDDDDSLSDNHGSTAVAIAEVVVKERKKPGPKPGSKKKPRASSISHEPILPSPVINKIRKKPGPKPGWKKRKRLETDGSSDESVNVQYPVAVPLEKIEAAERSRDILVHSIQRIPFIVSDSQIIRNFGRLTDESGVPPLQTLYSTPNALYPVGYSCDRFEFSPVHGRVIKLRCDILDGSKCLSQNGCDDEFDEDIKTILDSKSDKGPLFRIMWSKGIDEWDDRYRPFDLYGMSSNLEKDEVDGTALGSDTTNMKPEPGMRVKVRFDKDNWYQGTIGEVSSELSSVDDKKTKGTKVGETTKFSFNIQILYDDGSCEQLHFPDPDIVLLNPEDVVMTLDHKSLRARNVTIVVGKSPLEAWGKALIRLGMIDEIIFESALETIDESKVEGLAEAKNRLAALIKQRKEARARHYQKQKEKMSLVTSECGELNMHLEEQIDNPSTDKTEVTNEGVHDSKQMELPSDREQYLREKVLQLTQEYEDRIVQSRKIATTLADIRISNIGPHLLNPLNDKDSCESQIKTILDTIVRKEKVKMGSTGSKRKVVNTTDLLLKYASFFNYGIERLLEGLPGSETSPSYVFHEQRGPNANGVNQSWVYEVLSKLERDYCKDARNVSQSNSSVAMNPDDLKQFDDLKRRAKDDERESRKKQKLEEIEREKQVRKEERLSRLSTQIDDRLIKEAYLAREKIIAAATRALSREYSRRRRASEIIAAHNVEASRQSFDSCSVDIVSDDLPPLSKDYEADVVRIWNFCSTYRDALNTGGYCFPVLHLDDLQEAINRLRDERREQREQAIVLLSNLAVALCKPISLSLVKTLSSAVTTGSQEKTVDFTSGTDESDPDQFPVSLLTWMEIARLALLSDALNEVGYTKQDQAHILRGFRSGGHPNSKEAKKLRRGEDYALVLRQQHLQNTAILAGGKVSDGVKVKVSVPSQASAQPNDWLFFLHNVKSLPTNAVSLMKANIRKAITLLKSASQESLKGQNHLNLLHLSQSSLASLEQIGTSITSAAQIQDVCKLVKKQIVSTLENFTRKNHTEFNDPSIIPAKMKLRTSEISCSIQRTSRLRVGFVHSLRMSYEEYKKCIHRKEDYMGAALKLKEALERKKAKSDEDDEDDDFDEDEEDETSLDKISTRALDSKNFHHLSDSQTFESKKIGKVTEYDDFCGDNPTAPEPLRRCLAVLRTLCLSSPAEPFIFPVDPQTNSKYYDTILRPMSLYDAGKILQRAVVTSNSSEDVEFAVAEFGRNVRLIYRNCMCYSNIGGSIISAAEEMIRIFERLLFDWVLAPTELLTPLDLLDDDHCVEHHPSDEDYNVLICDGCEGKFNMNRLDPPLVSVPQGDWYCPRCLQGRCWSNVDPRINRTVEKMLSSDSSTEGSSLNLIGTIVMCVVSRPEGSNTKSSLSYIVRYCDGNEEIWTLENIDEALKRSGQTVSPVRCLEAVAESPGYGMSTDNGLILDILPAPLNPQVSDVAAQKALSSSIFEETIALSATLLLLEANELSASEWLRLLVLLLTKCASTDSLQEAISNLENVNLSRLNDSSSLIKLKSVYDVLPSVSDDEDTEQVSDIDEDVITNVTDVAEYSLKGMLAKTVSDQIPSLVSNSGKSTVEPIPNEEIVMQDGLDIDKPADVMSSNLVCDVVSPEDVIGETSFDVEKSKRLIDSIAAKNERQKAREDSFLSHGMKSQLKPTLATLEEDHVTHVIDAALAPKDEGFGLPASRCLGVSCYFCGLSDVALGMPLVRVPNDQEWVDLVSHASARRRFLVPAEMHSQRKNSQAMSRKESIDSCKSASTKLILVKIRLANKLVSSRTQTAVVDSYSDPHLTDYLPRNQLGFQHELKNRISDDLPYVSGSWSAHECCAVAAHKARCEKTMQKEKERIAEEYERDFGSYCGRSLPIGFDRLGRSYWKFAPDPCSLFVLIPSVGTRNESLLRFSEPESIASVIVALGNDNAVHELKRAFPDADALIKSRKWVDLLQKRKFPDLSYRVDEDDSSKDADGDSAKTIPLNKSCDSSNNENSAGHNSNDLPYAVGESVLVESASGTLLWNATILASSQSSRDGKTQAYYVHYTEWSSRFDEWVVASRIVEPTPHNMLVQEQFNSEIVAQRQFIPSSITLLAKSFINDPDRARSGASIPVFYDLFPQLSRASVDHDIFTSLKFGVLLVEAALPCGAVDTSKDGSWRPEFAFTWRSMVVQAVGPRSLAGCLILLENAIRKEWLRPNAEHLLTCMHRPFKAVHEACLSSIALRLWILDRGLKYTQSQLLDDEDSS